MKSVPVNSSTIGRIGYDSATRILEVEFRRGHEIYRYFEVPASVYAEFLNARSKGAYLDRVLKKAGYPYERIDSGRSG